MIRHDPSLLDALSARGVIVHAPGSVVLSDLDPSRIEAGVELFAGVTLCGRETLLRAGTRLGRGGGGYFEDVRAGRDVELLSGMFQDAVFLDGVTIRGHAEVRGGTLLEEGCEGAHHVGYKMTVMLPYVVAGSLINFCDTLIGGGTSRRDHTEIGSCLALYNFTPWGDKFASRFGDVPRGVFLRSKRIFIGGQTQIISPVQVGYGAVIPAGCSVRRDVPPERLYGEPPIGFDAPINTERYGGLRVKIMHTADFIAQLRALRLWYERVRLPLCHDEDVLQRALYQSACLQLDAGIAERHARLEKIAARLPASLRAHEADLAACDDEASTTPRSPHLRRIEEHRQVIAAWPDFSRRLAQPLKPPSEDAGVLEEITTRIRSFCEASVAKKTYIEGIKGALDDAIVARGVAFLERCVEAATPPWPAADAPQSTDVAR